MSRLLWPLLALSTMALAQTQDDSDDPPPPIKNFHLVSDGIARGGQPTSQGITYLAEHGYKLVIDLEGGDEPVKEQTLVEAHDGMRFVTEPLDPRKAPDPALRESRFKRILELLKDPKNHPVFLHCRHGWDRTGLAIGLHRVKNEGWKSDEAWKEMKKYGFHDIKLFRWMKDYFWSQAFEVPAPQVVEPIEESH